MSATIQTSKPWVSIITSCYNSQLYIAETIESVLAQSFKDFEFIIVDDASTDHSKRIITEYSERDSRIRLFVLAKNQGPAVARNTAIDNAEGRFIAFLDSDDLWHPEKLERQIAFMESKGRPFTFTHYMRMSEEGEAVDQVDDLPERINYYGLLRRNYIGCLTAVYDSYLLGKVLMPLINRRQDYGLWLKLLKITPHAECLPEILATYRIRRHSISSHKLHLLKYNWELFRKVENFSPPRALYYLSWNVLNRIVK